LDRTAPSIQPGYLSLKALALYSSCSVRWLRARLTDSKAPLPCYRIGGKVLVKVAEFDRWMAGYRACTQPDDLDQMVDDVIAHVAPRQSA
jgi:hypothetical protein